jgi:hypothetical protein
MSSGCVKENVVTVRVEECGNSVGRVWEMREGIERG